MLDKETRDSIKKNLKEIDREKKLDVKLEKYSYFKEDTINKIKEEIDELFSEIDLKPKKILIDDEDIPDL